MWVKFVKDNEDNILGFKWFKKEELFEVGVFEYRKCR